MEGKGKLQKVEGPILLDSLRKSLSNKFSILDTDDRKQKSPNYAKFYPLQCP